ncbi:L-threonylcarbamoyladenylate synthase [Thioalkalivibrio sp. HK1]|uniref:L-threonylcarbamoyladenylate synthase n=1 Tax=Thioalkalivibrio sp. HK1 TaxID=1469245 RepID=UPI000471E9C0|nr:L-threonylcarbamoyladenylate synthase [Thioalkalivibrio sp. HK1]
MSQRFEIHQDNPQQRLLSQICAILRSDGVIAYPTDSTWALGCCIGHRKAEDRIRSIRKIDASHEFSLLCRDISELASYGRLDNSAYRLLRSCTPGAYTFILNATRDVPRRLQDPKRRTVGVRVPDHKVLRSLIELHGEPLMSTSFMLPDDNLPPIDAADIMERAGNRVDAVLDAGSCGIEGTTIVDLTGDLPKVVREGRGDPTPFRA